VAEALKHVAAEEELQSEELRGVQHLPPEEVTERLVGVLVERVRSQKLILRRHEHYERQDQEIEPDVDPEMPSEASKRNVVIANALSGHQHDGQHGNHHVGHYAKARPPGPRHQVPLVAAVDFRVIRDELGEGRVAAEVSGQGERNGSRDEDDDRPEVQLLGTRGVRLRVGISPRIEQNSAEKQLDSRHWGAGL
jgi:hypothetical protein